ncbi:MAG: hypothetical protein AB1393_14680 [Candidatus Edwardsbacteria bacterium]
MRFFTENPDESVKQGVNWQRQESKIGTQKEYSETHINLSEITGFNGERISLRGEEQRTTLYTEGETGNWQFVTHEIAKPLACGCTPYPGMKIRVYRNGQASCEAHYYLCSLCGREIYPQSYTIVEEKFFHRHPCAEYVLRQILRNEKKNPTLPQNTLIYLENLLKDIRAERSIFWSIIYWRRSNASFQQ